MSDYDPNELANEEPYAGYNSQPLSTPVLPPGAPGRGPALPPVGPRGGPAPPSGLTINMTPGSRPGGPGGAPNAPPLPPQAPVPLPPPSTAITPGGPSGGMPPPPQAPPVPGAPPGGQGMPPSPGKPSKPGNQTLVDRILDLVTGASKKRQDEQRQAMLRQAMEAGAASVASGRPYGAPENRPLDVNDHIRNLLAQSQRGVERSPFVVPGSTTRQYPGMAMPQAQSQGAPQEAPQGVLRMMRGGYPFQYLNSSPGLPIREMARGGHGRMDFIGPRDKGDFGGHPMSYVPGDGNSGRSDQVDAKLSPNEYVMDAETVALLGDGSPDAGAKKLDGFRRNIREHKGRALAKGRISSDARSPESYLR